MDSIPGPRSRALARELAAVEPRGVTYLADDFPIFWESAHGSTVIDVDANRYIDLNAGFGAVASGHSNPRVASAIAAQAATLMHGMGDVHPSAIRVRLLERLATLAPGDLSQAYLCSSGSDAVEFALKTALLASGRPEVLAFSGAYHGLSYGALEVNGQAKFTAPFSAQLAKFAHIVPYGDLQAATHYLRQVPRIGAVIVEPIAGRAGTILPPPDFLRGLREACDRYRVIMIADEIYTGFGRTGAWFACDHDGVVPDIMCVGKALANGFPLAAAIGKAAVFNAWPASNGEALHTSTHLGNPLGCAAALANLTVFEEWDLIGRARLLEDRMRAALAAFPADTVAVRGRGAMWALQFDSATTAQGFVKRALRAGVIVLQTGERGDAVSLTPPLTITDTELDQALALLRGTMAEVPA